MPGVSQEPRTAHLGGCIRAGDAADVLAMPLITPRKPATNDDVIVVGSGTGQPVCHP